MTIPEKRIGFFQQAQKILSQVDSELQKQAYIRKIAYWTGTPLAEVQRYLSSTRHKIQPQSQPNMLLSVQERLLAAALQYPKEYADIATKYSLQPQLFLGYQELATKVLQPQPDLEDDEIALLLHSDLKINPTRKEEAIKTLVSSFLKLMYNQDSASLNASLTQIGLQQSSEDVLFAALHRQQELKQKYSQTRI